MRLAPSRLARPPREGWQALSSARLLLRLTLGLLLSLILAIGLGLLVTGCGGEASSPTASGSDNHTASTTPTARASPKPTLIRSKTSKTSSPKPKPTRSVASTRDVRRRDEGVEGPDRLRQRRPRRRRDHQVRLVDGPDRRWSLGLRAARSRAPSAARRQPPRRGRRHPSARRPHRRPLAASSTTTAPGRPTWVRAPGSAASALRSVGARITKVRRGTTLRFGALQAKVLSPGLALRRRQRGQRRPAARGRRQALPVHRRLHRAERVARGQHLRPRPAALPAQGRPPRLALLDLVELPR